MQEERQQSAEDIYVNDTQDVSDVANRDLSSAKRHSKISYNTVLVVIREYILLLKQLTSKDKRE
jgi:hypothetical protein